MFKTLKASAAAMKRNWSILVWFELLYRMILYIILYPAQRAILLKALDLAGTTYISQENFTLLLHSPPLYPDAVICPDLTVVFHLSGNNRAFTVL